MKTRRGLIKKSFGNAVLQSDTSFQPFPDKDTQISQNLDGYNQLNEGKALFVVSHF